MAKLNDRCICYRPGRHGGARVGGHQTWRLHTKLFKFGWNTFPNNARMNHHTDLNLGEVVYISIIFRIPLLLEFVWTVMIFFFLMAWPCKPAIAQCCARQLGFNAFVSSCTTSCAQPLSLLNPYFNTPDSSVKPGELSSTRAPTYHYRLLPSPHSLGHGNGEDSTNKLPQQ